MLKKGTVLIASALLLIGCAEKMDNRTPEDIGRAVSDKIIRETVFEFDHVLQKPAIDLQVIDYGNEFNYREGVFYSLANIHVEKECSINFGIDYTGAVKIFCNEEEVFQGVYDKPVRIKEIAYNLFDFGNYFTINLKTGDNKVLIKMVAGKEKPVIFLREVTEEHEAPLQGVFTNYYVIEKENPWLHCGPFEMSGNQKKSLDKVYEPEKEIKELYLTDTKIGWSFSKDHLLKKLKIREDNSYKRESYLEWHYANGNTLLGMLSLADKLAEDKYNGFVNEVCNFTIDNMDYFKWQFEKLHAIRGTNNRIFRSSMLDDTGAPALPYLQLYLKDRNEKYKALLDDISEYVLTEQVRLDDGTFCRPEPHKMTIWADDLFMSVPYLLRLGELTGNTRLYDDAANQVMNFYGYIFDEQKGICKHAWFDYKKEKSEVYWGRANGWMIWATSEALLHLPKDHVKYNTIKDQFAKHIEGLIALQGESGMWHQVLDYPESFEETSCTAMYILGIARGIKNGWIDAKYKPNVIKAWNELKKNVAEDGTVKDICRGTGIGYDLEFYFNRKRFDNDPRGLGAVLTASAEMVDFINEEEMK